MSLPFDYPADRIAVIDDQDRELSFGELDRRAKQLAQMIRAAGLEPGSHIAFCLENRLEYFWVLFGGHYAGVYYTAISPYLHEDEISYIVDNCEAELVIGSAKTLSKMAQARAECGNVRRWLGNIERLPGFVAMPKTHVAAAA